MWKLTVKFLCQNNSYGEDTKLEKDKEVARIADRAVAYSMPGIHVDGNDPVAMCKAAHQAIGRARAGEGPTLIEAMTFRFFGHVFGDADAYMDEGEKEAAIAADPYPALRRRLVANGLASEAALDEIESTVAAEIDEAVKFAFESPFPTSEELTTDVYGAMA